MSDASVLDGMSPPTADLSHTLAWTSFALKSGDTVYGVWASDPGHAWAVGSSSKVWSSTNQGNSWAESYVGGTVGPALKSIWGTSATDIFAVGDQGWIYHSSTAGGSWDVQQKPPVGGPSLPNIKSVFGVSSSDVYAARDDSPILHYIGGGAAWLAVQSPSSGGCVNDVCMAIWGSATDDFYAVGDGAQHWDGANWTNLSLPGTQGQWTGVWGSGKNDVYIVGSDPGPNTGLMLHSTDGGKTWVPSQFPALPVSAITGSSAQDVYVGCGGGVVLHSSDRGLSWQMQLTGAPNINSMWAIDSANVVAAGGIRFSG